MLEVNDKKVIYENKYYTIRVVDARAHSIEIDLIDYSRYYELVNRVSGVIELKHVSLPVMLFNAERWSVDLEKETYLWVRQAEAEAVAEVPEFTLAGEAPLIGSH